jgi:nucleotide-binding universal stress UspA family protein
VPPEDRADRAVHLAADLASRAPVEISLLRVLEEHMHPAGSRSPDEAERLRALIVEAEMRTLERMTSPLRGVCDALETRVCWGVPWEVVLAEVDRQSIDLVVKPARGLSHEGRVFFGATALNLFRRCPCPVWIVGDEGRLPSRVLAAIDPADDESRRSVAHRILDWAQWIADRSGARLHAASCWDAPAATLLGDALPEAEVKAYVEEVRSRAKQGLEMALDASAISLDADRVHLIEGDPRDALPAFAESAGFDLVVMGSLGRTGVAGELMGQTAELVVRSVRSSVMTISPRSGPAG